MSENNGTTQPERKRFKKALREEQVELENADGSVEVYTIKEMPGTQRDAYLNASKHRVTVKDGRPVVTEFKGIHSHLLSRCMFDSNGKAVEQSVIDSTFGGSLQFELFQIAQRVNALGEGAREEEKKD